MITRIAAGVPVAQFAIDVQYYLTQAPRQLPSRYFYDELGSALFDAICALPWYHITRAETRLLAAHGRAIFSGVPGLTTIVELGPGNGAKLATLVDGGRLRADRLDLHLVDISPSALDLAARSLTALPNVHVATYEARVRGRPGAGRGRHDRAARSCCFWDRTSAISTGPAPRPSCAASARACGPATRCSWGPIS